MLGARALGDAGVRQLAFGALPLQDVLEPVNAAKTRCVRAPIVISSTMVPLWLESFIDPPRHKL